MSWQCRTSRAKAIKGTDGNLQGCVLSRFLPRVSENNSSTFWFQLISCAVPSKLQSEALQNKKDNVSHLSEGEMKIYAGCYTV